MMGYMWVFTCVECGQSRYRRGWLRRNAIKTLRKHADEHALVCSKRKK